MVCALPTGMSLVRNRETVFNAIGWSASITA
jgi:hypothetical protein